MTRFARAKGSKASNERHPEEATPWHVLKNQPTNSNEENSSTNEELSTVIEPEDDNVSDEEEAIITLDNDATMDEDELRCGLQKIIDTQQKLDVKTQSPPSTITHTSIVYWDGFPIPATEVDRLKRLRTKLMQTCVPKAEVQAALKTERRRIEKAFARKKKKSCFRCRQRGHTLNDCPNTDLPSTSNSKTMCFKCGSLEHTYKQCKIVKGDNYNCATCFVCGEAGHISRQCPDNPRGLYPNGGACKLCGDVTHLKRNCPTYASQQDDLETQISSELIQEYDMKPDDLPETVSPSKKRPKKKTKVVKF